MRVYKITDENIHTPWRWIIWGSSFSYLLHKTKLVLKKILQYSTIPYEQNKFKWPYQWYLQICTWVCNTPVHVNTPVRNRSPTMSEKLTNPFTPTCKKKKYREADIQTLLKKAGGYHTNQKLNQKGQNKIWLCKSATSNHQIFKWSKEQLVFSLDWYRTNQILCFFQLKGSRHTFLLIFFPLRSNYNVFEDFLCQSFH